VSDRWAIAIIAAVGITLLLIVAVVRDVPILRVTITEEPR